MGTKKLLTVDEILKMSDDDYMDERQLAFFKQRLQAMEVELRANADQTTVNLRETTVVPDPADRATIEEEHALELRTRDRERKLLKKVQAALKRIEDGAGVHDDLLDRIEQINTTLYGMKERKDGI